jgi:arylsulfatase
MDGMGYPTARFPRGRSLLVPLLLAVVAAGCNGEPPPEETPTSAADAPGDARPNIVYILADDLGFADLGVFGSEIPTPNLDSLARAGMLLTDFHTGLTCSPTRSMLMSGTDNHVAGLGVMNRSSREDQRDAPGYEAHLNFRVASLADLMSDAGYDTYVAGKWHLGGEVETGPRARGFKRSFVSLSGAAHLGGLSWNGPDLAPYRDGDELVTVGGDFYSTRVYTEKMIEYIEQDRAAGRPFFAWLAYTAPHWPLQAPPESIARFNGWYDDGWEALARRRFERMKELGFIGADATFYDDGVWERRWNDLSADEQRDMARRMEIYAAMVADLDRYVGEFVDYLRRIGEYDNTLIVFSSDNGTENIRRDQAQPLADWVAECCDNRYANLGAADSYLMYGEDWATAGTVAFRRHKGTAFEGGIRVPAFATWPGEIEPGQRSDAFGTVMDLLPTFLDLADHAAPDTQYRGRDVAPIRGRSLRPVLTGEAEEVHPPDSYTGWELFGHRAIRQGDWKVVWDQGAGDEARWMLFDLATDPGERNDLAEAEPARLARLVALWDRYVEETGVVY